ncbi:MAG TPA: wax ester/triacylglycerol synthase domain-containing protein [Acidimicrobiales bacterium]|nr:wax ester/triacylglycerol synthase domain-containing protein [Acidimicrobiales bacterium]
MAGNPRPLRFERRMSDAEALMWNVEKDPSLRSTFLNVTFLDGPPSFEGFRKRIERAVEEIPRLRQRVVPAPARLAPPEWVDDPSFDLDFHVRQVALPPPGTDRDLLDLAALHFQDPFDRARPLWQFTIVEGLQDGRAVLLAKMHHTITDGVGGVRLSAMFIDLERDAADPEPRAHDLENGAPFADVPEGIVSSVGKSVAHELRRQLGIGQRTAMALVDTALHPTKAASMATGSVEIARSMLRQLLVLDGARSPLWAGRRSLQRHFEVLTVDLEKLKAQANALGGSVNDAFVACVAGGAGAYHREKGVEIDDLRVAMPVSTRGDKSAGGNAFAPTRSLLPAGTKDPVERFEAIRSRLGTTKKERAVDLTDSLAGVLNSLPTSVVVNLARQQAETVDFATSNVRGAPWDLFIAGAEILHNHPMGPTGGTAFNATVLSYRGNLDLGLNIDTAAVDDPGLLKACIDDSFREFLSIKV